MKEIAALVAGCARAVRACESAAGKIVLEFEARVVAERGKECLCIVAGAT
jgi:hypothetical protein